MIKDFPLNTFKKLDMVLVLARYNGKWALYSEDGIWKCPEEFLQEGEDDYIAASQLIIDQCNVEEFELIPVWDFQSTEENITGRAYYANLKTCADSSFGLFKNLPDNFIFNHELAVENFGKAEVIALSHILVEFLSNLKEVRAYNVKRRNLVGSLSEISSYEIELMVEDVNTFVFDFPLMLEEKFDAELRAYRIFQDKYVLNISLSKFNPLFVVRFSIMR